jgi:hypothetical protein
LGLTATDRWIQIHTTHTRYCTTCTHGCHTWPARPLRLARAHVCMSARSAQMYSCLVCICVSCSPFPGLMKYCDSCHIQCLSMVSAWPRTEANVPSQYRTTGWLPLPRHRDHQFGSVPDTKVDTRTEHRLWGCMHIAGAGS